MKFAATVAVFLGINILVFGLPAFAILNSDQNIDSATLVVYCGNYEGTVWQFAPGRYLTANHVVKHCNVPQIKTSDGLKSSKVVMHDFSYDIAELKSSYIASGIIHLSGRTVKDNEYLRIRSAPNGILKTTFGNVTNIRSIDKIPSIVISSKLAPGSSGGVITDRTGTAVGLIQKNVPGVPEMAIGIREPYMSRFLALKLNGISTRPEIKILSNRTETSLLIMISTLTLIIAISIIFLNQRRKHRIASMIQENRNIPIVLGKKFLDGELNG